MKAPSKVMLIVMMAIAIAIMAFANNFSFNHLRVKSEAEMEQEEHDQQAAAMAKSVGKAPADPRAVSTGAAPDANSGKIQLASLGQDSILGPKTSSAPEVTIQWSWTPEVQANPDKVTNAIDAITRHMPNARVHVVNTDESAGTPDGIFVGGKLVTPAAADGSIVARPEALEGVLGKK